MRRSPTKRDWTAVGMVGPNVTSAMDEKEEDGKPLKPDTKYEYYIYAYNQSARSGASNITTVVTLSPRIAQPTNLTGSASSANSITLNWNDNSQESGFTIMRQRRGMTSWEKIAMVPADTPTYTDRNLQPATMYTIVSAPSTTRETQTPRTM